MSRISINQNALKSLLTSPKAKKVMEKQLVDKLSSIKCPVHKTSPKNIKITGNSPQSLKVTAGYCCQEMKVKLEDYIKKSK